MEHNFLTSIVHICTSPKLLEIMIELKKWMINKPYTHTYSTNVSSSVISPVTHTRLINEVNKLLERVYDSTASSGECLDILKYGVVVLDSVKYNLDYKKARSDFRIDELKTKYFG